MVSRSNSGWQILNRLLKLTPKQKHIIQQNIFVRCLTDGVKNEPLDIDSEDDFPDGVPFDSLRRGRGDYRQGRDSHTSGGFRQSRDSYTSGGFRQSRDSYTGGGFRQSRDSYTGGGFRQSRDSYTSGEFSDSDRKSFPRSRLYDSGYAFDDSNKDWLFPQKQSSGNLRPLEKNFYKEHPEVANASKEEVQRFLDEHKITYDGENILNPIMKFEHGNFPAEIMELIKKHQWQNPTPIQSVSWPMALSGRDSIGIAQTGSGKTLGFILPGLIHCKAQPVLRSGDGPIAIILVPTRELAQQVDLVAKAFGRAMRMQSTPVYGGSSKTFQVRCLSKGSEIVVATPGRLNDLLLMGVTNLNNCSYVVLDEADRMLDMGFEPQIRNIVKSIRADRQTLMWSATWPMDIRNLAKDFLTDPLRVNVGSTGLIANENIKQMFKVVHDVNSKNREFFQFVHESLKEKGGKILVFTSTKILADHLTATLRRQRFGAGSFHSDRSQREREQMLKDFRKGYFDVLVATNVAARGLDVDDISCVINYDCPGNSEEYIHRIGRTARAGKFGTSLTFLLEGQMSDQNVAKQIFKVMRNNNQTPDKELEDYVNSFRERGSRRNRRQGNPRSIYLEV